MQCQREQDNSDNVVVVAFIEVKTLRLKSYDLFTLNRVLQVFFKSGRRRRGGQPTMRRWSMLLLLWYVCV
jgi:hypothetical protein